MDYPRDKYVYRNYRGGWELQYKMLYWIPMFHELKYKEKVDILQLYSELFIMEHTGSYDQDHIALRTLFAYITQVEDGVN